MRALLSRTIPEAFLVKMVAGALLASLALACTKTPENGPSVPLAGAPVTVVPAQPAAQESTLQDLAPPESLALDEAVPVGDGPRLALPARPADGISGTAFVQATAKVSSGERERMIEREFLRGNVPDFLRELKMVEIQGEATAIRLWVMPDYIAIGSNDDFVRMPMTTRTAVRLAHATGMGLPTPRIVKHIAHQASLRTTPRPLPPGPEMVTSAYFERHNRLIEDEIGHHLFGELIAGDKKDVVVSKLSLEDPNRMVIFGWHARDNNPIQGVSNVHDIDYVDYSHGVRLISMTVEVDGEDSTLAAALAAPQTAALISHEGPLEDYAALLDAAAPDPAGDRSSPAIACLEE